MKVISLNGKWTYKPDHGNLGIVYKCYFPNNHSIDDSNLLGLMEDLSENMIEKRALFK